MADKQPWLGPQTFPRIWLQICRIWAFVAIGALIMPAVVWVMILTENTNVYQHELGHYMGNDPNLYGGDIESGFVNKTNIPKHLGGVVFAAVFESAMVVLIFIALAGDLFWRFPIALAFLKAFWTAGLYDEAGLVSIQYTFLIANAFLKLFIVAATGSMSYTGLLPNNESIDTTLFGLYATFILLGSIPFSVIAFFYLIHNQRKGTYDAEQATAAEAAKAKKKKEADAKKAAAAAAAKNNGKKENK